MDLQHNVRSVGKVIGLSIITFGIYYLVYLFKTLNEMENAFPYTPEEIKPKEVRYILIIYIVVSVIIGFAVGINTVINFAGSHVLQIITIVVSASFTVAFWGSFVNLIGLCQNKRGTTAFNKFLFWIPIGITVSIQFIYTFIEKGTGLQMALSLMSSVSGIFLLCITVIQVNRIWQVIPEKQNT